MGSVPMANDSLHQVVLNLAMNAIDATPPGGNVQLRAVDAEGAMRIACDEGRTMSAQRERLRAWAYSDL